MKVNFLLPDTGISGGNRVVFEHANRLSQRGHDVTLIYPLVPTKMAEKWFAPKVRGNQLMGAIFRLAGGVDVDWFDVDVPVRRIPSLAPQVVRMNQSQIPDADVTVATAWQTAYAVAALDNSKGAKVYFIQHYEIWKVWNSPSAWNRVASIADDQSSYPIEMSEVVPPSEEVRREKRLVDQSFELPLAKVTVSPWLSELLETKFEVNVVDVIPNSINHGVFYPEPGGTDATTILLPYRSAAWKGTQEVLEVAEALGECDIDLITFGSGDEIELPDSVTHHSDLSDDQLRRLYSAAEVFVFPSWVEGYGLPPFEAMACETAVVSTGVGVVPEIANDGVSAAIVPPRDSSALIDEVRELVANPNRRSRLRANGRKLVSDFSWNRSTDRFEATLEVLCNHS